jgi:hypothetical protein
MKKVTLFACLLVLTLGANAQVTTFVRPNAIPPNARRVAASENGVTTVSPQAPKPTSNGGPQAPPIAKVPPHVNTVPPVAKK